MKETPKGDRDFNKKVETPKSDPLFDRIEQLLEQSEMLNNNFFNYEAFA